MSAPKILVIDDDPGVLKTAELLLVKAGYGFRAAQSPAEAYSVLAAEPVDAILLDLNFSRAQMSGEEGLACLREILRYDPKAVVIVVTGHSGLTIAVQALRAGARNFIMKPWNNERLLEALEEAMTHRDHAVTLAEPSDGLDAPDTGPIVGACDAVVRTKELITRYAPLTAPILFMGETGTGKSLMAQALHRQSRRTGWITTDSASLTLSDLNDVAHTTLVLEDIERLDPALAQPLIAWLPLAGRRNTRVVATTSRSPMDIGLPKALLYALSTLEVVLPPLSDRGQDIDLLAQHFARVFSLQQGLGDRRLAPDALLALRGATWQDNLHALRRVVERALAGSHGAVVTAADLDLPRPLDPSARDLGLSLERSERRVIEEALSRHNFNISKAADALGLTRQTLYRRMARHGL